MFDSGEVEKGYSLLEIDSNQLVITCPSRFSRRKGQVDLLKALSLLEGSLQKKIVCVLAGSTNSASNQYYEEILKLVDNCGFLSVVRGFHRDQMPHIFAATHLVVMPSYKEGLGFSAIESLASKCPVLLNKVSGFNEIPDSEGQIEFCTPGNVRELSDKIRCLLLNSKNREELANKGYQLVKNKFSKTKMSEQIINFYAQLLGE